MAGENTNGDPAPNGGETPQQPPAETQQTLSPDELKQFVSNMVTGAVAAHVKKEVPRALTETLGNYNWKETLEPVLKDIAPSPPEPADQQKPDPRLTALEQKYQSLEQQYRTEQQARQESEEKRRDDRTFATLRSTLQGADPSAPQVRPEALDAAAKLLFFADKRISYDDAGNPLMTVRRAPYPGAAEEDIQLPLADGVAHWLKTPEGKFFAPAPAAQPGAGNPGPGVQFAPRTGIRTENGMPVYDKPATTDQEKQRRALEVEAALRQKYPDRFRQ